MNVLQAAKEVIRQKGWTKGSFESYGRVCSLGAIYTVVYGNASGYRTDDTSNDEWMALRTASLNAADRIIKIANELYPYKDDPYSMGWESVARFNDHADTTKEMVMHVFSHAAAESELTDEPVVES